MNHSVRGLGASALVAVDEWSALRLVYEKRHLLAHKKGVIDDKYAMTVDKTAKLGHKVPVSEAELRDALQIVRTMARRLVDQMAVQ
jgi:hypothetical protein